MIKPFHWTPDLKAWHWRVVIRMGTYRWIGVEFYIGNCVRGYDFHWCLRHPKPIIRKHQYPPMNCSDMSVPVNPTNRKDMS